MSNAGRKAQRAAGDPAGNGGSTEAAPTAPSAARMATFGTEQRNGGGNYLHNNNHNNHHNPQGSGGQQPLSLPNGPYRSRALPQIRQPSVAAGREAAAAAASAEFAWKRLPRPSPMATLARQVPSPGWHSQSGLRRTVSVGTQRTPVVSGGRHFVGGPGPGAAPLPPVSARVRSPSQRLTEMARVFSSGVVYSAHRQGSSETLEGSRAAALAASSSGKKRL